MLNLELMIIISYRVARVNVSESLLKVRLQQDLKNLDFEIVRGKEDGHSVQGRSPRMICPILQRPV